MAGEWTETTLGSVVDFLSGGTPSKHRADFWGGSMPWVSAKDMKRFRIDDTEDHVTDEGIANGTRLIPKGTVLMLTRGMTLIDDVPICIANRPMTFNQDVKALRPKKPVHENFLPYLLLGNKDRLLSMVDLAGHGTGRLNSDELKALPFSIPPESEQRAIAHILGTLDDKIELNRRMNETLEAMARAIFKSWFVDFLPVRAKMTARNNDPSLLLPQAEPNVWFVYVIECNDGSLYIGQTEDLRQRWLQHLADRGANWTKRHPPVRIPWWERQPSREEAVDREKWLKTGFGRKWLKKEIAASARTQTGDPVRAKADGRQPAGMDPATAELFPDSFEDSTLGKIPKGWRVATLGEEFDLTMGQSPPGEYYNNVGDGIPFYQGRADFGFRYPQVRVSCTAPTRFANAGDTLVSVRAPVGNINMAAEGCCIGRGLAAVRHKSGSRSYTYYCMCALEREFALFEAVGTVFGAMSKGDFHAIEWISPPSQVIQAFEKLVFPIDQQIENNEGQLHTLTSMRDTLLSKLISGELRLKDTELFLAGGFV